MNIFQNTPVGPDRRVTYQAAESRAGDYVEMRALRDCLIAATACPCDIARDSVPSVNRAAPTPILLRLLT